MKFNLVLSSLALCLFSFKAFASETIPSCNAQYISEDDLQPYKYKTYSVEESESVGSVAETLFNSMQNGNMHRDRFGNVFFEEREQYLHAAPINWRYQLLEYDYCRKSTTETRCIRFCTVALTVNPGDHD